MANTSNQTRRKDPDEALRVLEDAWSYFTPESATRGSSSTATRSSEEKDMLTQMARRAFT
ncbi:hypothetical protein [Litorisediminicola beolgyonensis]|uniref:Uncharacterized protein n=1 Tax=Litorisediminicola beolgyonensis TaxID=1173614 RepID=A0ABW3ZD80_9RHOB